MSKVRIVHITLGSMHLRLLEVQRRVQRNRAVSLNDIVYEVDAAPVGEKVILRYDPRAPPTRGIQI